MLKDIQKAIGKVFSDYEVLVQANNEAFEDKDTLAAVMAVEVLKEITAQPKPQPQQRKANNRNNDPKPNESGKLQDAKPADPKPADPKPTPQLVPLNGGAST